MMNPKSQSDKRLLAILQSSVLLIGTLAPHTSLAATTEHLWGITLGPGGSLTPNTSPKHCPIYKHKSRYRASNIQGQGALGGIFGIGKWRTRTREAYNEPVDGPCLILDRVNMVGSKKHRKLNLDFDLADYLRNKKTFGPRAKIVWPKAMTPKLPNGAKIGHYSFQYDNRGAGNPSVGLYSVTSPEVLWLDGAIEGIEIPTAGLKYQQDFLTMLTQKFGKPTRFDPKVVQSLGGATVNAFEAQWETTDFHIYFDSVQDSHKGFTQGYITIDTHRGWEARQTKKKRRIESPVEF